MVKKVRVGSGTVTTDYTPSTNYEDYGYLSWVATPAAGWHFVRMTLDDLYSSTNIWESTEATGKVFVDNLTDYMLTAYFAEDSSLQHTGLIMRDAETGAILESAKNGKILRDD